MYKHRRAQDGCHRSGELKLDIPDIPFTQCRVRTPCQSFSPWTQEGKCIPSAPGVNLKQPLSIQIPILAAQPTSHILIQGQGHSHITDLDGFKVTFNDHIGRLDISMEQLLIIVQILRSRENLLTSAYICGEAGSAIGFGQQSTSFFNI